jgi:hypothetical protein
MKVNFSSRVIVGHFLWLAFMGAGFATFAQALPTVPDESKMTYNQISNSLKLYVFPGKGQKQDQQKKEELECYKWATEQSGIDPANPPKVQAAPAQTGPTGGAVVGAAKGAAAGVAIGAIAGDAGEGAAIGAVAGAIAGRRAGKKAQAQANQKASSDVAAKEKEMKDSFIKGFTACMEGKGYTVK